MSQFSCIERSYVKGGIPLIPPSTEWPRAPGSSATLLERAIVYAYNYNGTHRKYKIRGNHLIVFTRFRSCCILLSQLTNARQNSCTIYNHILMWRSYGRSDSITLDCVCEKCCAISFSRFLVDIRILLVLIEPVEASTGAPF